MVSKLAGRIRLFSHVWERITNDFSVINSVNGYKIPFTKKVVQNNIPPEPELSPHEHAACHSVITELIRKGAISPCKLCEGQFLSSYFLREKSNGENRFILNLKKLNKFIEAPHFKLEDIRTALKLVTRKCYMATIDLKDSYFLVPIHKKYKKYLRFQFEGKLYEFNVLPFGLSTAPYAFTKLLKPVAQKLRSRGFMSVIYIDDILMIARNEKECKKNVQSTQRLLESLGFVINKEKSQLIPGQKCKFLGFILDAEDFSIYLTDKKRDNISKAVSSLIQKKSTTIRLVAQTIGILIAACPAVNYGWLYTKRLERDKFLALKVHDGNFDKRMMISDNMRLDLKWWIKNINSARNPIRDNKYCLEIFTDASLTGWGTYCRGEKTHGWWKNTEKKDHINLLELKAALNGLKCFAKQKTNCEILLRIDNTTAISYINRMGGIQHPKLNNIAREVWQWCESKKIHVFASYINTKDNKHADAESRILPPETEWEIADWAFTRISIKLGCPEIDLFASNINAKCKKFISWHKDPEAIAVDAFTVSWTDLAFYAFPPFSLILKVLRKIVVDEAEGIVVVPFWPTQPWFPQYKSLSITPLIQLGPQPNLLTSIFSKTHPLSTKLSLVAARLSSKP